MRLAREHANKLVAEGKEVKIFCVGRKGYEQLRRQYEKQIVEHVELRSVRVLGFEQRRGDRATRSSRLYEQGAFDVCTLFFSRFKSVIAQIPTAQQIIPPVFETLPASGRGQSGRRGSTNTSPTRRKSWPSFCRATSRCRSSARSWRTPPPFYGAQMSAMDNATRNAGDMIRKQTLTYNRTRQAMITKELIEIISGAEAL